MKNEEKFPRSTGKAVTFPGEEQRPLKQEQPGEPGNGWNVKSERKLLGDQPQEVSQNQNQELQLCSQAQKALRRAGRVTSMED